MARLYEAPTGLKLQGCAFGELKCSTNIIFIDMIALFCAFQRGYELPFNRRIWHIGRTLVSQYYAFRKKGNRIFGILKNKIKTNQKKIIPRKFKAIQL